MNWAKINDHCNLFVEFKPEVNAIRYDKPKEKKELREAVLKFREEIKQKKKKLNRQETSALRRKKIVEKRASELLKRKEKLILRNRKRGLCVPGNMRDQLRLEKEALASKFSRARRHERRVYTQKIKAMSGKVKKLSVEEYLKLKLEGK